MRIIIYILGTLAILLQAKASVEVVDLNSTNIHSHGISVQSHVTEGGNRRFHVVFKPKGTQPSDWEASLRIKKDKKFISSCKVAKEKWVKGAKDVVDSDQTDRGEFRFMIAVDHAPSSELRLVYNRIELQSYFAYRLQLGDFIKKE